MQSWEYLVLSRVGGAWTDDRADGRSQADKLTALGNDNWELVSVCYDGSGYNFYLKRLVGGQVKAPAKKSKAK